MAPRIPLLAFLIYFYCTRKIVYVLKFFKVGAHVILGMKVTVNPWKVIM